MANTRMRGLRVPDDRWARAQQRAAGDSTNLTAVVNSALEQYAAGTFTPTVELQQTA